MLPPDARTILTDALRPPPETILDHAVGTTFTLDLASALIVPLAFAAREMRESVDPITVMESVRASADRLDVFCQAGNISTPGRQSDLLAFLEPMIHPVHRPRPGRLFHPKVWLLRYRGADNPVRLVVLSRNLTADRSWDVCLRLDGTIGTRPRAANRPLADLVRALPGLCVHPLPSDRAERLEQLAADVRYAEWELPNDVADVRFHALGIPGGRVPDFHGNRHLVVAPFCNEAGLALTAPASVGRVTLVGRQEQLDRLPERVVAGCTALVVNELAGVPSGDDRQGEILTGLHAKAFVIEKGHRARLLVGSANATDAAFRGNVELLVELEGSKWKLGIDTLVGDDAEFRSILEPYQRQPVEDDDAAGNRLEEVLRDLAAVPMTVTVEARESMWSTRLATNTAVNWSPEHVRRVTAELVTRPGEARDLAAGQRIDAGFGGLEVVDITPFVVLRAEGQDGRDCRTVVRARLVGDPAGRLDEVLARQIDSPEKFLRLVALLLGLATDGSAQGVLSGQDGGDWGEWTGPGLFELLIRSLVDRPAALADLTRLVARLRSTERGRAALPPGFDELWDAVSVVERELAAEVPA